MAINVILPGPLPLEAQPSECSPKMVNTGVDCGAWMHVGEAQRRPARCCGREPLVPRETRDRGCTVRRNPPLDRLVSRAVDEQHHAAVVRDDTDCSATVDGDVSSLVG